MKPLEDQIAELIAGWREYAEAHTKTMGASATLTAGAFATCATELENLLREAARAQRTARCIGYGHITDYEKR